MPATSSSRYTEANYWRDPVSGNGFQIQVQLPQNRVQSVEDLNVVPVMKNVRIPMAKPMFSVTRNAKKFI